VPAVSAVISFGVGLLFFLPAPSWYRLVGFISSALVLSTLAASVALVVLRRTAPRLSRPFRLRGAAIFSPAGFAAATLIIYWCGFVTLFNLVTILVGGMAVYAVCFSCQQRWTGRRPATVLGAVFVVAWAWVTGSSGFLLAPADITAPEDGVLAGHLAGMVLLAAAFLAVLHVMSPPEGRTHLRGGYWLVFLLLALLCVSAIGEYGPMPAPLLAFPADSLSALVVGIAAYYWAIATGFRTREIIELEAESC
jgi:amino acid transporter